MTMKKNVDGVDVEMTPEEEAEFLESAQISGSMAPPLSVSARQFKLQLLAQGLLDSVEAWVSSQSRAIQISYQNSSEFVRSAPMMAEGFAAMGFTDQQIDDFFTAASKL